MPRGVKKTDESKSVADNNVTVREADDKIDSTPTSVTIEIPEESKTESTSGSERVKERLQRRNPKSQNNLNLKIQNRKFLTDSITLNVLFHCI